MFGGRRTYDAWAETQTRLAWVRKHPLQKLLSDDPTTWIVSAPSASDDRRCTRSV
jgi:hypothetical protein